MQQQLNKLKRRQLGYPVFPEMFPFKVYNITNPITATDSWRTFQVRGGCFNVRSKYHVFTTAVYQGNYEIPLFNFGTDVYLTDPTRGTTIDNLDSPLIVNSDVTDGIFSQFTLPTSGDTNITQTTAPIPMEPDGPVGQILLNSAADGDGVYRAAFWLVIVDSPLPGPFRIDLYARMWSPNPGATGRTALPFPSTSPSIIPLATVEIEADQTTINTVQYITSNQIARYPDGVQIFRGFWSADSLANQVFYNGDVVIDDSAVIAKSLVSPAGTFNYYHVWGFNGTFALKALSPQNDPTGWRIIGAQLSAAP